MFLTSVRRVQGMDVIGFGVISPNADYGSMSRYLCITR